MRKYLQIDLGTQSVTSETLDGEAIVDCGRHFIAKTLLEGGAATVDPLSPENPLIFSVGPFAGTNFSNANRISVGCKSPLTGGVKEANSGGTFGFSMGQLEIAGFTLNGASSEWVVIRITKDEGITFETAEPYLGKRNKEAAAMLFEKYGDKVSLSICSNVGEYQGLLAGIAFTDPEGRPERLAARGGVGAVMGSKKVKAIVIDKNKMPTFKDRKKVMTAVKDYNALLDVQPPVQTMRDLGTANMADVTNYMGALPVRNFSVGQMVDPSKETFEMGGAHIRERNLERGGVTTHACMPGCTIKCSNAYYNAEGEEVVAPLEYETIGLMGTNCGISNPDDVAVLNGMANDLGVDTIETGAMLGVLMEAGQAEFGDMDFLVKALEDISAGNERGKLLAQGTARVGEHYGVRRVPVIKKQALSAYDPRVIEVTGVTMMVTAQGADHTAGNLPAFECKDKTTKEIVEASLQVQRNFALSDSIGLCIFGRSVTDTNYDMIAAAINDGIGTNIDADYLRNHAQETLDLEDAFNNAAGFTEADDELPDFFYSEALAPTGKKAPHRSAEVNQSKRELLGNV